MTGKGQVRLTSNAEVAKELLDLDGRRVIDIGCGGGKLTRTLARQEDGGFVFDQPTRVSLLRKMTCKPGS